MTDTKALIERLRQAYHNDLTDCPILLDAADELDVLERERDVSREKYRVMKEEIELLAGMYGDETERLREALEQIEQMIDPIDPHVAVSTDILRSTLGNIGRIARAALEAKP